MLTALVRVRRPRRWLESCAARAATEESVSSVAKDSVASVGPHAVEARGRKRAEVVGIKDLAVARHHRAHDVGPRAVRHHARLLELIRRAVVALETHHDDAGGRGAARI